MIRWLFIIAFMPLSWGEALEHTQENQPLPAQEQNLLILVDLQGALFYPKATGAKFATIQNQKVADSITALKKQGARVLYLAEHSSETMFWQNSITKSALPFEENFSLSNEIFRGFEGSMPSCRFGIVLCQSQPLGEILGLVINQLWVWTQFAPKKIIFFTNSKERGEIVSAIGLRIGAFTEVNLVRGIVGTAPILNTKKPETSTLMQTMQTEKIKKHKPSIRKIKSLNDILQKATDSSKSFSSQEKMHPPIAIDESKLENV